MRAMPPWGWLGLEDFHAPRSMPRLHALLSSRASPRRSSRPGLAARLAALFAPPPLAPALRPVPARRPR